MNTPAPDTNGIIDAIRVLRIELGIANDHIARAAGLHPQDLDVLDVIDRDAPTTPSHLVSRTGIRPATLTGILGRLERAGWIHRSLDPRDARSAHLTPTPRFEELRALYRHGDQRVRDLTAALDDTTRATIERFLHDTADAARTASHRLTCEAPQSPGPRPNPTDTGSNS